MSNYDYQKIQRGEDIFRWVCIAIIGATVAFIPYVASLDGPTPTRWESWNTLCQDRGGVTQALGGTDWKYDPPFAVCKDGQVVGPKEER